MDTNMNKTFTVIIDGVETILRFDSLSDSRGYQYLTPGNASSHVFNTPLQVGQAFRTNGHLYEVIGLTKE